MLITPVLKKRFFFVVAASLLITGCNAPIKDGTGLIKTDTSNNGETSTLINLSADNIHVNDQIRIPEGDSTDFQNAKITQLYFSALGQPCMQVTTTVKQQKRLFCHLQNEQWKQMPLLENLTTQVKK